MKRSRIDIAIDNAKSEIAFYQRLLAALESTREAHMDLTLSELSKPDRPTRGRGRPKKATPPTQEA